MKQTKYDVVFPNKQTKVFYGFDIYDAIIQGYEYCRQVGLTKSIQSMKDEYGNVYTDITLPTYKKVSL